MAGLYHLKILNSFNVQKHHQITFFLAFLEEHKADNIPKPQKPHPHDVCCQAFPYKALLPLQQQKTPSQQNHKIGADLNIQQRRFRYPVEDKTLK